MRDADGGAASDFDVGAEDVPVSGAGAGIGLGAGRGAGSGPGPGPGTTIDCPPLWEAGSGTGSVGRIEP